MELEYVAQEARGWEFCTTAKKSSRPLKAKDVVINNGKSVNPLSLGDRKMIILSYVSPPETFDEAVGEFDQMVQSFRLIKD